MSSGFVLNFLKFFCYSDIRSMKIVVLLHEIAVEVYKHICFTMPCFTALCFLYFVNITIFRNWGFVTTLRWASLSTPFFPTAFAHFVSVSRSVNSQSISNFFITIIFVMVIYDEWSLMLLSNYFAAPWRRQTCLTF